MKMVLAMLKKIFTAAGNVPFAPSRDDIGFDILASRFWRH